MKRAWLLATVLGLAACHPPVSPEVLKQYQERQLYTCCNIYYEGAEVADANYHAGSTLPFGSPVVVEKMTSDSVSFASGVTKLTLAQRYGQAQESINQYVDKILVPADPHLRFTTFPKAVQSAIQDGRVERGMSKEQVLMSLGYPPTHRTASTDLGTWVYWYNRWKTYNVIFDDQGVVDSIVGDAPTNNAPIVAPTPVPTAAPAKRGKRK